MQLYSLPTILAALLFIAGIGICIYWSRRDKPKNNNRKGNTLLIFLAFILITGCTRQVASGVYPIKRWKGYRVVCEIPTESRDCGYTKFLVKNDKRFIEVYTPIWFGDVYANGDTVQ